MPDTFYALLTLSGALLGIWLGIRTSSTEKKAAEVQEDHRDRDAYEAEIAKVEHDRLSAKDAAEVAELRAFVEEIGTGEFPSLAFVADPLGAPIPDGHLVAEPAFFHDVTADWLSTFAWPTSPAPPVPFSSVQVVEPDPYEAMSFTQDIWKAVDLERMVAQAKAQASR